MHSNNAWANNTKRTDETNQEDEIMEKIEITIKDKKDLMYLWVALNHLQTIGRMDLARNITKSDEIEKQWIKEAVDDFDRIMTLKAQISQYLER